MLNYFRVECCEILYIGQIFQPVGVEAGKMIAAASLLYLVCVYNVHTVILCGRRNELL